jgi:hypothetical protein
MVLLSCPLGRKSLCGGLLVETSNLAMQMGGIIQYRCEKQNTLQLPKLDD